MTAFDTPANSGSYDGAARSHRTRYWVTSAAGPNTDLGNSHGTLKDRSRSGYRNSPLIYSGIEKNVTNEVGLGMTVRSSSSDDQFSNQADQLWKQVVQTLDPAGVLSFRAMQAQACRGRRTSGEVFILRRWRSASMGLPVPLQVQILESDQVPIDLNQRLPNGNRIKQGVEFNRRGQRVAYWMYREHPGERDEDTGSPVRISARNVIHHYLPTRPGQIRGEPDAVQALLKERTFAEYDDAELVRKKTRAPFTGFMYRDDFDVADEDNWLYDPVTGAKLDDVGNVPEATIQAGSILTGLGGEKLDLFKADDAGQGYSDFMRWQSLLIASGMNIPYELLTGDWSKVNDRLVRAILNEYRRNIEMAQDHLMGFQVCRGIWHWFIQAAVVSGALPASDFADKRQDFQSCDIRAHGFRLINPEQDLKAKKLEEDLLLKSKPAQAAEMGGDAIQTLKEQAEYERQRKKYLPDHEGSASKQEPQGRKPSSGEDE